MNFKDRDVVSIKDISKTEINYIPTKTSTLINSYMSMGACVIDSLGVTTLRCLES